MREHRVYSPEPLQAASRQRLAAAPSEHLLRVLRLRAGARFTVFDGRGGEHEAELIGVEARCALVQLGSFEPIERESPFDIALLQALVRAEKMDWIVQKATELGVTRIVPVEAARSVVQLDERRAQRRTERWQEIAIGACEQCGRNRVPEVLEPVSFSRCVESWSSRGAATANATHGRFVLDPTATSSFADALRRTNVSLHHTERGGVKEVIAARPALALLLGPEGGFDPAELEAARRAGFEPVALGPRVLRTETAALAALATIQAMLDVDRQRAS